MDNYTTKTTKIDNGKGYWNSLKVEIFKGDEKVGEYKRNYSSLFKTFFPFEVDGKEYALYSPDYTSTRVMSLPDCKDLGGEERSAGGFCPTDFYVPTICVIEPNPNDPKPIVANHQPGKWATIVNEKAWSRYYWPDDKDNPNYSPQLEKEYIKARDESHKLASEWRARNPFVEKTAPFGFVAGCVWGDDSSWKIQFLDLSKVSEGIIKRDDRFGYIELPSGCDLSQAINTEHYDYDSPYIEIAVATRFSLSGEKQNDD